MTSLPQLPQLPGLSGVPPLVGTAEQQAAGTNSTLGAIGKGIVDGLTYDPFAAPVSSAALRGVLVVGGLAMILIGFLMFRQTQTVIRFGANAAKKVAEGAAVAA